MPADTTLNVCEMCGKVCSTLSGLTLHRKKCNGPGQKNPPNRSAIGKRSKNKGHAGERRIAKLLSDFTGKNFRKVPGSGGFGKQGVVVAERTFTGDIVSDDPTFAFSVECKNRANDFSFAQLATVPDKAPFSEWWYQTVEDAKSVNLLPILFFKASSSSTQTVGADFIALTVEGMKRLGYPADMPKIVFDLYNKPITIVLKDRKKGTVVTQLPRAYIISWRLITQYVDPDRFFGDL